MGKVVYVIAVSLLITACASGYGSGNKQSSYYSPYYNYGYSAEGAGKTGYPSHGYYPQGYYPQGYYSQDSYPQETYNYGQSNNGYERAVHQTGIVAIEDWTLLDD